MVTNSFLISIGEQFVKRHGNKMTELFVKVFIFIRNELAGSCILKIFPSMIELNNESFAQISILFSLIA